MTTPRQAAIYARISRDTAGTGLGVERQESLCRKLAADKGWDVAEVYTDNDLSAYSRKARPAYDRMIADLEAGSRDAVLVVDTDRLVRRTVELEAFIALAETHGVALANVSGDLDLATSDGRFRARIMGAVAQQESEKKSERLRRQRDQHAASGKPMGGRRGYGYEPNGIDIRPDEAEIVREVARRFLAGESLPRLAADLNARSVPAARGGRWRTNSLRSMLAGPRVAGMRMHRGEVVGKGTWEPILDEVTHRRIVAVLGDPRRAQAGRPPSQLLVGLLRCGKCGGKMYAKLKQRTYRQYVCDMSQPGGCGGVVIAGCELDDHVTGLVLAVLEDGVTGRLADVVDQDGAVARLDEAITTVDDRLREAASARFVEGVLSHLEYVRVRGELEQRAAGLRRERDRLLAATGLRSVPMGDGVAERWEQAVLEERRAWLRAVVERVTVGPITRPRGREVQLDRVAIAWRA